MKVKFISKLFLFSSILLALASCNSDSETDVSYDWSKNAQINSLTLTAIARTSADTVNYAVLAKTRFSIDQTALEIYNPEPLPYKTTLKKFFPTFTFNGGTTLTVEVNYLADGISVMSDSLVTLASTDSIDFSKKLQLVVTPLSGTPKRTYDVSLRVYKNDPDSIIWDQTQTQLPAAVGNTGNTTKTFLIDNKFYTFVGTSSSLELYTTATASPLSWNSETLSSAPSNANVKSMVYVNDQFYLLDASGSLYTSADTGITWTSITNTQNVTAIIGVLPKRQAQTADEFLVLLNDLSFGKTTDLTTIYDITSASGLASLPTKFPRSNYSTYTNYQGAGSYNNQLIVVGGIDGDNNPINATWNIFNLEDDAAIQIGTNNGNSLLGTDTDGNVVAKDICIFYYNNVLYAYSQGNFYTSPFDWGAKWIAMPSKQGPGSLWKGIKGTSILVDNDNNIWMIGGDNSNSVLKGKLNSYQPWNWVP